MSDDVAVHPELVTDLVEASLPPYGAAKAVVDAVMGGDDAPVQPQGGV